MRRVRAKWLWLLPAVLFAIAWVDRAQTSAGPDWRRASREPVGLAPDPAEVTDAVVQVYAARTVRWRGYFGVHTWIAAKRRGADEYTVYEVNGWRLRRTGTSVAVSNRPPDARWFGNAPRLLAQAAGPGVEALIDRIEAAVDAYPYARTYRIWPGPNSNTFTAHVLRAVPELRVDLPATAIGKDYLGWDLFAKAPSGTGGQVSVLGILGVLAAVEEGLEINVLGLTFGVDPLDLALKVPLAGRLGWPSDVPELALLQADGDEQR
ncbi:MAG TPA: DUF3750 domain-containing protein [Gammaproteobacteria bacterium]